MAAEFLCLKNSLCQTVVYNIGAGGDWEREQLVFVIAVLA